MADRDSDYLGVKPDPFPAALYGILIEVGVDDIDDQSRVGELVLHLVRSAYIYGRMFEQHNAWSLLSIFQPEEWGIPQSPALEWRDMLEDFDLGESLRIQREESGDEEFPDLSELDEDD